MPRTVLLLHSSAGRYGADRQLATLVRGLDPRRWRAVCVLPERGPLVDRLETAGAHVVVHPLAVLRRSLATPAGAGRMALAAARDRRILGALARREHAAVVHDNTSVVLAGGTVARAAGAAHVVHVREIWTGSPSPAERLLWPAMRRRLVNADALACISEAVRAQFAGADRALLVPDALEWAPEPGDRAQARSALGVAGDAFVVAMVGRVHPWKGQDVLARALAEPALHARGAVALVAGDAVAGSGEDARLDALAARVGVADRVRRLGFHEDVGQVLAAADVLAVPSTRPEPLGLVALEGAAAGLPVVASAAGGVAELVRHGETGLLVPPGDPAALAGALDELAADPTTRARMGRAGARMVAQRPSATEVAAQLQDLYDRLAPV